MTMTRAQRTYGYFDKEALQTGLKKKAIQGGGAMLFSRTLSLGIQVLSTVILARLLTPGDFGLVTMVTAFSLLFFNVGINGFREAIIQKEDITHRQLSSVFWIGLGISTCLALLFSACSPLLARFYKEPRLISIAIVLSIGFIFSALATEHTALIMRTMQFKKLMINEIVASLLSTGLAIGMAYRGFGYWAIVARHLSYPILSTLCAWLQCPWRPGWPARDPEVWRILKFASKTFGIFLINYFGRNLDKILIGRKWGKQELGNYDRAYYLFVTPASQLVDPLTGVALSTLSRLNKDPERYEQYFIKALSLISLIGMLVSVIMTVGGRDIVLFLLGPQWQKTGTIFSALGPAIGMTVVYGTIGWLHLSQGNPGRWLRWGLIAFIFNALSILAGLRFGALGVAIAYSFSLYVLTWPGIRYAAKPMGIRMGHIWKAIWRLYAAAVLSGVAVWLIAFKLRPVQAFMANAHLLLRLGILAASCTLLYLGAVVVLFGRIGPLLDMWTILRTMIPARGARKPAGCD